MSVTFIHLTDSHLGESVESLTYFYAPGAVLARALRHIAENGRQGAAFIAQTGDLIWSCNSPRAYETAKAIYGFEAGAPVPGPLLVRSDGLDLPWYFIPGNTDHRQECLRRLFPGSAPAARFNCTWEVNGIRFLSLDWEAQNTNAYTLRPATYAWLKRQLQASVPTVILTHHPPVLVGVEFFDAMTPPDLHRLQDLIRKSSVIAVFHGHTHYPWENRIGPIPVFGTGSLTFRRSLYHEAAFEIHPPQYRVVTVFEDGRVSAPIVEVPQTPLP